MSEQPNNIKIAAFFATSIERWTLIGIGAALIITGVLIGGIAGIIIGLIGLVPVGLGITNRCIISKVIRAPWKGQDAINMINS